MNACLLDGVQNGIGDQADAEEAAHDPGLQNLEIGIRSENEGIWF